MTNAVQALVPRQISDDAALYQHLEHLHLMFQHSGDLFWMLILHQLLMAPLGDHHERHRLLLDVLEKCRQLQDNIRRSVEVILQLVSQRESGRELQFIE